MNKDNMITLLIIAGGGIALYWYLNNYGPYGPADGTAAHPSWWQTWFGGVAPTQPTTQTSPVTTTQTGAGAGAGGGTTVTTAPALPSVPYASIVGAISTDINNALKGSVSINGAAPITIDIIPANAGAGSGFIWNSAGQDITGNYTSAQQQQILAAFQAAAAQQGIAVPGLSGIVPTPWAQNASNLSGISAMPTSMSFGKGFGQGFRGRRVSTPPMKPVVN